MKILLQILVTGFISFSFSQSNQTNPKNMNANFALAIHGGAGNMLKRKFTIEQEIEYKKVLEKALEEGYQLLKNGAKATDVVESVIKILEDSPLFNAGKGSVFSNEGKNEMDAAIMDGESLKCGAATNLRTIKNPISLAKTIMNNSKFVFLNGVGAEQFAKENNLEIVDTSYFFDQRRWNEMLKIRDSTKTILDNEGSGSINDLDNINKFGTVGCVVLDKYGNLAAGTSTGGITNKKYNRIGDSPIIGAGTYANNNTCAISCTGHGEDFIRLVVAHKVSSYMELRHLSLKRSAENVINKELTAIGGRGGLIGIDKKGNIVFSFNTTGMFRGSINTKGEKFIAIYK